MDHLTDENARNKVWELIQDIRIAQLVTQSDTDGLSSRPMAAMNRDFDGTLWFFTSAASPKIAEIERNPNVLLCYSKINKQEYISLQGKAQISNDREKISSLWSEAARIWFPQGAQDPDIRLIKVDVTRAEYWDSPSSALVMVYGYVSARLTGETPKLGENRKVTFSAA